MLDYHCEECASILRELIDTAQSERNKLRSRLQGIAEDVERPSVQVSQLWIRAVAGMPDEKFEAMSKTRTSPELRQRQQQHEMETGHSILMHGRFTLMAAGSVDFRVAAMLVPTLF